MRWESIALTDPGLVRPNNEDALLESGERGVFAVADGMGGHAAGEVASRIAVEALQHELSVARPRSTNPAQPLVRAFVVANREIRRRGRAEPEKKGMGTTMSVLAVSAAGRATIAHVGDSRVYRMRGGRLEQLTRDHTWVQDRVDAGVLTPSQARAHPYSSILTRVLGTEDSVLPDVVAVDVEPGDFFLLCSDGLSGMVRDGDLEAQLKDGDDLSSIGQRLVALAKAGGGQDNITLLLVHALPD